ncbi:MAG: type II toxin-antitoxin system VapC family toxin [Acidobacteriaceae bacterium]|nr:type II toxin-antitoxin system VapC family toxin [Acidobacteriaceae bacterium]
MILLDTHVVLWLAQAPELLSATAVSVIEAARQEDGLAISDKSLWELAQIIADKDVSVDPSPEDFLEACAQVFQVLPITPGIAWRSMQFSKKYPKDPADRIIAATAIVHGLPLITKDGKIRKSGEVACIW